MNPLLVKQTAILSAILGGILGILTLVPFIQGFSFLFLFLGVAALIIIYMKRNDLIGIIDVKEGMALGGIIGFVSFIAFATVFIPLDLLFGALLGIFKLPYNTYGLNIFIQSGFFVLVIIIIFMGILNALMNAFSGLVTIYMYEVLTGVKKEEKQEENVDFEIKS
jgi:MFS family permease